MRLWPFGRRPKQEHYLGEYTEPSFRGAVLMLVVSLVILAILWMAYSWALNQHGVDDPNAVIDRVAWSVAGLVIP